MKRTLSVVLAGVTLLVLPSAAFAQGQQAPQGARVSGTVKSVGPGDVVVTTASGDVDVAITSQTRVLVRQTGDIRDIKPGAYLGTSNQDGAAAGTGTATEIHMMDNGPNVNSPMNSSGLTMTNGHVKTVTATAKGEEMDVDYGQAATRHVVVPKDTAITKMTDLGVAGLKPGLTVNVMTAAGTGKPTATYISVGAPPARPKP